MIVPINLDLLRDLLGLAESRAEDIQEEAAETGDGRMARKALRTVELAKRLVEDR